MEDRPKYVSGSLEAFICFFGLYKDYAVGVEGLGFSDIMR